MLVASSQLTISLAALSSGILFGSYLMSSSRNPEESTKLYGSTLTFFALIETFVFIGLLVIGMGYLLI